MQDYNASDLYLKLDPQSPDFRRAAHRARVLRPHVRALSVAGRTYSVRSGRGSHSYRVRLAFAGGHALGLCECAAGANGKLCYHLPVALGFAAGIKAAGKAAAR